VACGGSVEYYFSAAGSASGTSNAPAGAPTAFFTTSAGTPTATTLLAANFEGGLPAGWTTSSLWHITGGCVQAPACNGTMWAYFGNDTFCNYAGPTRSFGSLTAPALALPTLNPGEGLDLTFCCSLGREAYANVDVARVRVNGVVVADLGAANTAWNTRSVDLTAYAGQNVTIDWFFDTVDTFDNLSLGWQVDNIRLERIGVACVPPTCQADLNSDGTINGADLSVLLSNFGTTNATPQQGDINVDTVVNGADLSVLLSEFGNTCE
jgi:hypothetical protein